jgi:hypothetical protein
MPRRREPSPRGAAAPPPLIASLVAALQNEAWDDARRVLKKNPSLVDPEIGGQVGRAVAAQATRGTKRRPRITSTHDLRSKSERDFVAWMETAAVDVAESE